MPTCGAKGAGADFRWSQTPPWRLSLAPGDLLLLLTDGEHVLLALREGTGYAAIWTESAEA